MKIRTALRSSHLGCNTTRAVTWVPGVVVRVKAALLAVGLAILFAQAGSQAVVQPPDALPFSTSYLLTGDYAVGSIDVKNPSGGVSTGTIKMNGVPANADILAAFLYWEAISPQIGRAAAAGVLFRGQPITSVRVKAASKALTGDIAACFAGAAGAKMTMFRADVLPLLPPQKDKNGVPTGKLLVNDADLTAAGLPVNTVTLPDTTGNNTPQGSAVRPLPSDALERVRQLERGRPPRGARLPPTHQGDPSQDSRPGSRRHAHRSGRRRSVLQRQLRDEGTGRAVARTLSAPRTASCSPGAGSSR